MGSRSEDGEPTESHDNVALRQRHVWVLCCAVIRTRIELRILTATTSGLLAKYGARASPELLAAQWRTVGGMEQFLHASSTRLDRQWLARNADLAFFWLEAHAGTVYRSLPTVIEELQRYLPGGKNYFQLQQSLTLLQGLDGWIRHRLRMLQLKHWKNAETAKKTLLALGLTEAEVAKVAENLKCWWRNSTYLLSKALPPKWFDAQGLPRLATNLNSPNRRMRTRTSCGVEGAWRGRLHHPASPR